jgi:hypothetical protein
MFGFRRLAQQACAAVSGARGLAGKARARQKKDSVPESVRRRRLCAPQRAALT